MKIKEKVEGWFSENSLFILIFIFFLAITSIVIVLYYYPFSFISFPPNKTEAVAPWGQMGDFFGGILNPLFGFLSVIALLVALAIQSRELKISTDELKKSSEALNAQNKVLTHQSFEQTFFSWLENYRDMLSSIEDVTNGEEFRGKRALRKWWRDGLSDDAAIRCLIGKTPDAVQDDFGHIPKGVFKQIAQNSPLTLTDAAFKSWERIYRKNEYQLDSLFRNLYRLILWIDSQHKDRVSPAQKWLYVSIVRAQISWIEMVYLFYNGYTERGKKFKHFVEKYALFDNLNFTSDKVLMHLREFPPEGAVYSGNAYDSSMARKDLRLPESTEEVLAMAVV